MRCSGWGRTAYMVHSEVLVVNKETRFNVIHERMHRMTVVSVVRRSGHAYEVLCMRGRGHVIRSRECGS